ncbi:metallophosphoesterase family protein [Polymorphum gilvum]|uniref:Ser/Thr protein phosphatase family protein n=1 Tax=Polymorphum gilvum (strain LMG 25793 / CGMCC 1.9160 / SL003B-26A1) TaxID=991905 RepID=F2IZM5_POLGS|nr:metallophosphoesterase [Polymorphum gilvum]ADZ69582.1 Ser/Thr protein phosphatase family protein [Polymorphum gilvum SL003B-26A1]
MFRLAHFSDPHLGPLPDPRLSQLLSKRILGYVNWRRNRARAMSGDFLVRLLDDMRAAAPDHVALTGDLVNIALPLEIEAARAWLESLSAPDDLSLVPGNHDAYVPGALKSALEAWRPYMTGDARPALEPHGHQVQFPFVRKRDGIAIVGVSTARASAPWLATGKIGIAQARRLEEALARLGAEGLFRVVMIHHPPFRKATAWHKRLQDASRVRAAIRKAGAELVLHGHTHVDSRETLKGPDGPIPVIGVPSATNAPGGRKPGARYNLFDIAPRDSGGWSCHLTERGFTAPGRAIETIADCELAIPVPR